MALLKYQKQITRWLKKHHILNYQLIEHEEYGYVVDVMGSVNLGLGDNLESIDVKFNVVHGYFICDHQALTSLEGAPEKVKGDFSCSYNQLRDLKYCPKIIKGEFRASNNNLQNLIYFPDEVGMGVYLSKNQKLGELQNQRKAEPFYQEHYYQIIEFNKIELANKIEQQIDALDNLTCIEHAKRNKI